MHRYSWIILLVFYSHTCKAQRTDDFQFRCTLPEAEAGWYTVPLTIEMLSNMNNRLSDLRIIGMDDNNDTLEAPYLLRRTEEASGSLAVAFKRLNSVYNEKGSFFTFELPENVSVNQLELNFANTEYDWKIQLQGSQDQREWFTLTDNYRILAIQNPSVSFTYTTVQFPPASFRFIRLWIKTKDQVNLIDASVQQAVKKETSWNNYSRLMWAARDSAAARTSIVEVDLGGSLPVSHVRVHVSDTIDFYRRMTIACCTDSVSTGAGWVRKYHEVWRGFFHSFNDTWQGLSLTKSRYWRITVFNEDNVPLKFLAVDVRGPQYRLITRLPVDARFALYYGHPNLGAPAYDLVHFSERIPDAPPVLIAYREEILAGATVIQAVPLIQKKQWLWVVLIIIMAILVIFATRMLRKS
jgi:hypothetical protein